MKKSTSDEKFKLGRQYLNGEGVKQDDKQAVHWWRLAAEEGNADAQCSLGMAYWEGQGVKQDDEQAVHWSRLAAAHIFEPILKAIRIAISRAA